ncbi:MAG: 16S rRNA (guanine(966)-N(2))-methyltransferase RsmD [Oscillospiraceae bacterium]|nr:16S rRNA (guanine(966)-N(2))-methyltransferase RsmD [Oscillospiraceae bacterium]
MRIITGKARGKRLQTLEGRDVRPTTERIKESLFNILQFDIEGRRFLDLFAGSGQVGLEAVSRGAKNAVLVDSSRDSIQVIQRNVQNTGLGEWTQVIQSDYRAYLLRKDGKFDLAFLDPPYETGLLEDALPLVVQRMTVGGTIVCEHPTEETLPETVGDFVQVRSYRYGKILLTLYRHKEVVEP